jgi:hypothetical protein
MRVAILIAVLFVALLTPISAAAHEDYETIVTPPGFAPDIDEPVEVVLHWTDGIVAYDPVKLIIRKADGEVLAETRYYRDILLFDVSGAEYAVAMQPWSVFYADAWQYDSGKLETAGGLDVMTLVLLSSLADHWLAYTTSISLCIGAGAAWFARKGDAALWRWASLLALASFFTVIAIVTAAFVPEDVFLGICVKIVVAMLVVFGIRACSDARTTLQLSGYVAALWMLLLTLYGYALPLLVIVLSGLVILALYFLDDMLRFTTAATEK